ncbi:MAG TPA: pro-sigmaK processing inhibitor BofA family protein [Methanoregulaceae archaeon]|nr:pro-sigmaK processing inhibitor BofA family protein [Methanoregulaceae archaeon]
MDISGAGLLIIVLVVAAVVGFFVIKNIIKLAINSILGLILLYFVNYFHVMAYFGKPDIPINVVSFLICLFGGIPGALLLILLNIMGITV